YLKATIDLYQYLYSQDPHLVVVFETGVRLPGVDFEALSQDKSFQVLLNHVLETKKLIIESSISSKIVPLPAEKSEPMLNAVIDALVQKYGAEVVRQVFTSKSIEIPAKISGAVFIDFYITVAKQGPVNAGNIMRYIAEVRL